MCVNGKGAPTIAKVLEEKGIFDLMNKLKHNEKAFKIMESVFLN